MKYQLLYEWGRDELTAGHIEEAQLDARLLLEAVCGTAKHDLLIRGGEEVNQEYETKYREFIQLRRTHIPLQHILGSQEFMGLVFRVNGDVLIPRQDTEILVEEVRRFLYDGQELLDLCTGSGCILLSILQYSNNCRGVGADISPAALAVARENARLLELEAEFVESDLLRGITGKYDMITCNPPYIPSPVIPTLMPEVRDYEPWIALDGDIDGLRFYREIVSAVGQYLHRGGMLFFEIGHDQANAVTKMMDAAGFGEISVVQDLAGLDRVVSGVYGGM